MVTKGLLLVSIIIPCYNEEKYISQCLNSLLSNNYPKESLEILVIDGISNDDTREIVKSYLKKYLFIKMIDNPYTVQVKGLNLGLKLAKGKIIIRCDSHAVYPNNYISEIVKWHNKNIADNIGGIWDTVPGGNTIIAKAIAFAMSHPIGVGFSYRTSRNEKERYVDTVPFGSWKKDIFNEVGFFDDNFIRAQDLEHNIRMKKMGKKILMLPWLKIKYFARDNYKILYSRKRRAIKLLHII